MNTSRRFVSHMSPFIRFISTDKTFSFISVFFFFFHRCFFISILTSQNLFASVESLQITEDDLPEVLDLELFTLFLYSANCKSMHSES